MVKPVIDVGKAENTIQLSPNLSPPRTANQFIVFKIYSGLTDWMIFGVRV